MSTFKFKAKSFFLTYSQSDISLVDLLAFLKGIFKSKFNANITEYVICRELHEDGNPHSHCFVMLDRELNNTTDARVLDYQGHHPSIEPTRSCKAVIKYCAAEGNYLTNIEAKIKRYRGEASRLDRNTIAQKIMDGTKLHTLVDENPSLLFGYSRLKNDVACYMLDKATIKDLEGPCGLWIGGPAGAGKSTIAFSRFGDYYPKGKNKWFDGYNGQPTMVLDDVDSSWVEFKDYLKWWAGQFKFLAEFKGGTMLIRPSKCVVTSNFTLEEWLTKCGISEQSTEWRAFTRRFKQYWITSIDDWEDQL